MVNNNGNHWTVKANNFVEFNKSTDISVRVEGELI